MCHKSRKSLQKFLLLILAFCLWHFLFVGAKDCKTAKQRATANLCVDGKHNLIKGYSPKTPLPVNIKYLHSTVYTSDSKPSCYGNRPSVILPGFTNIFEGEMIVPPNNYDLVKSGKVRLTIVNPNFDKPICLNGTSQYLALPSFVCNFDLCEFIGRDTCEFLQKPGKHSIREMVQKIGFNSTREFPEPPSILGISFLDLFAGEFRFGFALETEGKTIGEFELPTNMDYVPIGMRADDGEEELEGC